MAAFAPLNQIVWHECATTTGALLGCKKCGPKMSDRHGVCMCVCVETEKGLVGEDNDMHRQRRTHTLMAKRRGEGAEEQQQRGY